MQETQLAQVGCPGRISIQIAVIVAIMATKIAVAVSAAPGATERFVITEVYGPGLAEQVAWVCLKSAQMTNAGMN